APGLRVPERSRGSGLAQRSGVSDPRRSAGRSTSKARPRWGRIFLVLIGFMAVLGFTGLACGLYFADSLDKRINRTDAFDDITGGRPAKLVDGALNLLIIGSDSRAPGEDPSVNGDRSDALMIAHLDRDHRKAYIVSIPRDTWVNVPRDADGNGGQRAKINAASTWGGIPLMVSTVERFSGVKIDHVLKIDFAGFKKMTDALGGVDVSVSQTVTDPRSKRTFTQGVNHLDGAAALDYVRQRYDLPRGDFDRVHRQHIFLRALLQKATDSGTLTNPGKLKAFSEAAADSVTADRKFSLTDTAVQLRKLRNDDVSFIAMPVSGTDLRDGQSVVISDREAAGRLFRAVARDDVATWLQSNPASNTALGN
ncbi:MAG: LCP family protein, partial [Mycobacteriales bacterium]